MCELNTVVVIMRLPGDTSENGASLRRRVSGHALTSSFHLNNVVGITIVVAGAVFFRGFRH